VKSILTSILVASLVLVMGCTQQGTVQKEHVGMAGGAALGGLLGAQIGSGTGQLAATAAGAVVGGLVGQQIGRTMDEVDRMRVHNTLENTPTGRTTAWQNPDTGARYEMTPTETFTRGDGTPCREYTTEAWIDGELEVVRGTACRQPDGTWRAV